MQAALEALYQALTPHADSYGTVFLPLTVGALGSFVPDVPALAGYVRACAWRNAR